MAEIISVDQLNRELVLAQPAKRIVSLVPSQTELLFTLQCNELIVGRTKFCIHPKEKVHKISKVGGTKNFNFEKIDRLAPDLVIANKEENKKEDITALWEKYQVWVSDVVDIKDNIEMISKLGLLLNRKQLSDTIIHKLENRLACFLPIKAMSVLYLIWKNPYMAVGNHTYINTMLELCGFENCLKEINRYPIINVNEIIKRQPNVIFLSSEPYPFSHKHLEELKGICPKARIILVDGEMFSWHGSRIIDAIDYFKTIIEKLENY